MRKAFGERIRVAMIKIYSKSVNIILIHRNERTNIIKRKQEEEEEDKEERQNTTCVCFNFAIYCIYHMA